MFFIKKLLFHNFLIVYRTSNWIRKHFTHNGLLFLSGTISAGVFGIDTRQTLSYQIFSLLLCVLVIAFITTLTFRSRYRITRLLPPYGTVGDKLQYKIILSVQTAGKNENITVMDELATDRPSFREYLNIHDKQDIKRNLFDRLIGYPRMVSLIQRKRGAFIKPAWIGTVRAGQNIEKKVELMPIRRGYLRFNHALVARPDTFGLFRKLTRVKHTGTILILPRCHDFPDIRLPGKRKYQHGGMTLASSVGDSEEFFSLRDYRPGDPMRNIHWRSYAKKGEPVVKEYQDEYFSRMSMVLDTFIDNKPEHLFEDAVSIAASILTGNRQQDALLDLLFINTRTYQFTTGRGLAGVESAMEVLACIDGTTEDNFDDLSRLVLNHTTETSGFIFVFLDWDEKRKKLVNELKLQKIPLYVIVITGQNKFDLQPDDPMYEMQDFFMAIKAGEIEKSLQEVKYR